jgi:hypothetical protein
LKKSNLIIAAAVTAVVGAASIGGMQLVSAQSNNDAADGKTSIIDKLAQKFNLKPADVKAVFDQNRAEHQAARQQKITDELTQLVKDGKLTEAQKQLILAKMTEVQAQTQANHDSMKDKTPAERKAAMDVEKADLEAWAKANDIPTSDLHLMGGPRGMGRGGMEHGDMKPGDMEKGGTERSGNMMHDEANEPTNTN